MSEDNLLVNEPRRENGDRRLELGRIVVLMLKVGEANGWTRARLKATLDARCSGRPRSLS